MPGAAHVAAGARMLAADLAEALVLAHQRGDMADRVADRDHEPGVVKQPVKISEAGDVVVSLGEVAGAAAHPQQLAQVIAVETLELRVRSEEHTSELQSLMRHSYAVFCL